MRQTDDGRVFYVDHTTRTTHWHRPGNDTRVGLALPEVRAFTITRGLS